MKGGSLRRGALRHGGNNGKNPAAGGDDAALGSGIGMALQTPQTTVVLCHTLEEARRELAQEVFSLLILDINLPDGSGLELLREQKSIHPEVPAILLTANDLELDEVTGLEAGAACQAIFPVGTPGTGGRSAQARQGCVSGGADDGALPV